MANVMKISGPLLLLVTLLAAGARADDITTAECAARGGGWGRVRQYPVDGRATEFFITSCGLTSIPQHRLSGLPAVTTLWLSYNELRELPVFDEYLCANLSYLPSKKLTGIPTSMTFSACTKLEQLNLDNNRIEVINTSAFTALTHLTHLDLQRNMIRYIPDQLLAANGKLEHLFLNDNRITHLPPDFASRLKRAGAGLHTFHFHDNQWNCACLIELLADVRRAGVVDYHKGDYVGGAPACVYTDAAPCCRHAPTGLRGRGGR